MTRIFRSLYAWVLIAIIAGALLGALAPELGVRGKVLGDAFIALIKMLIGPIVFCTVVEGLAGAGNLKQAGRIGLKCLVYFEVVSTLALMLGVVAANGLKPGSGFNVDVHALDPKLVGEYITPPLNSAPSLLLRMIPKTFVDAFTGGGDLVQILGIAVLFGSALGSLGEKGRLIHEGVGALAQVFFEMVAMVMWLAPVGAGGAMAFTVGRFGPESLRSLAQFMGVFYLTCGVFIVVVLGALAASIRINIFRFLFAIRRELLTVLGTSSSESVLVPMMGKLEEFGCAKQVVGLVVPSGYSFNLDGTNIYLSLSVLFVAQALNIDLTWRQQLSVLLVATVTSKGAAGVTGSGFVTLAATLAVVPEVPPVALALLLGVDRFMSEARAVTNTIGNGIATLFIANWEGALDRSRLGALEIPARFRSRAGKA